MRPPVSLLWVVAWLTLAVGPARAADQPGVVALPPFMVEELAKGPPWRYAMTRDFEVLSRCDDASTRRITESYYRLHRLLALVLPEKLQVRFAVPKTLICYDEDMHPAASQEIINQIMSRGNAAPVPTPEEMGGFGGRGFRGGVSPPTPRYSFLPNMRLWDKDALAVFSIMRSGSYDDEHMVLTADYASYLARSRAPSLPRGPARRPRPPSLRPGHDGWLRPARRSARGRHAYFQGRRRSGRGHAAV